MDDRGLNSGDGRRRGDKRVRTRAVLLEAAGDLIREVGYDGATLDAIARRAGMSRGAIYGNFANRDDLFAAVALDRWKPVTPVYMEGASFTDHMRELGRCYYRAAQARIDVAVHAASFQLQTRMHPELAKRMAWQARELIARSAEELAAIYPTHALPMPAERLVRILGALGEGLMAEYFLDPDGYDEALFVAAFEKFGR